jgi:hypothetical protein
MEVEYIEERVYDLLYVVYHYLVVEPEENGGNRNQFTQNPLRDSNHAAMKYKSET